MSDSAADCKHEAGVFHPVINRNACEGKEDCQRVCPYGVFEIRKLKPAEKEGMSMLGKLKAFAHGDVQAFAVNEQACHGCGLCVAACPEDAIKLERVK
jgi:4Fe-4S ferredoxin